MLWYQTIEEVVPRFTVCLTISQCCEGLSITSHDWYKHAVPVSFVLTVHNRNNSIIQELSKVRFMTDGGPGPPGAHARTRSKKQLDPSRRFATILPTLATQTHNP